MRPCSLFPVFNVPRRQQEIRIVRQPRGEASITHAGATKLFTGMVSVAFFG